MRNLLHHRYLSSVRTIALVIGVVVAGLCQSRGQEKSTPAGKDSTREVEYNILSLVTPADTFAVKDSIRITLGMYLDCTNRVTKFDRRIDTTADHRIAVVSVYGTSYAGAHRPLCPARFERKDFFLRLPESGAWTVKVREPEGKAGTGRLQGKVFVK